MAEDSFYDNFKENMDAMGLPCPQSLFGTLAAATATIGAIAGAIKTYGTAATLSEIVLTIPFGASATAAAAGVGELCAVAGALAAAFYLGACIGSLIAATIETYGPFAYSKISGVLDGVSKSLGMSIMQFLQMTVYRYPGMSPVRGSIVEARRVTPMQRKK